MFSVFLILSVLVDGDVHRTPPLPMASVAACHEKAAEFLGQGVPEGAASVGALCVMAPMPGRDG